MGTEAPIPERSTGSAHAAASSPPHVFVDVSDLPRSSCRPRSPSSESEGSRSVRPRVTFDPIVLARSPGQEQQDRAIADVDADLPR
eukprot:7853101-Pyramimonas_sp.AAC.1